MTRPKVLWHSNAPWVGTGYGTQTALFVPELAKLGFDVAVSAFYGLHGSRQEWADPSGRRFRVYPASYNTHGNDVFVAHSGHWFNRSKGIFFILTDPWVLVPELVSRLPSVAWVPIDHDPVIPATRDWFKASGAIPVAMSRFGQRVLAEGGAEDPLYLPHAFDPAIFHERDRIQAREAAKLPQDDFVVGMVAANKGVPSRKGFSQALSAFAILQERHRDVRIYLHTAMRTHDGEDLVKMVEALKIKPLIPQQYLYATGMPANHVANLMAGFDVLLNPAHGEGFGVPILEAAACGTPAIVTDFSSMPEVAGPGGWCVPGQPVWTGFDSWQRVPDVEAIVDALEQAYAEADVDRRKRRKRTLKHAAQYAVTEVASAHLAPLMEDVVRRLDWDEIQGSVKEL